MTKKKDPKDLLPPNGGRPVLPYDQKMAADICQMIATSTDALRKILASNPAWPSEFTIRQWRFTNPVFSAMYADAKRQQADLLAEEIVEISDDGTNDYMQDKHGNDKVNFENIQRSRLRVDTRKWLAAKLMPKMYGEKTTTEAHIFAHEVSIKELDDQ